MEELITLITKFIRNEVITKEDFYPLLFEMCDQVHAYCGPDCLVYSLNGNKIPDTANDFNVNRGCDCFKNGRLMYEFIEKHV